MASYTTVCPGRVTNLNDTPADDKDAVNQNYVDAKSHKSRVKAATTGNINLASTSTVDGVSIVNGDRVLVKDQSTATENGIYIMDSGSLVRANGAEITDDASGTSVFVTDGTVNDDTMWYCTDTYGTLFGSAITFVKFDEGDVFGPGSSSDNTVARFDGVSGKIVQGSGVTIDDSDNLTSSGYIQTSDSLKLEDSAKTITIQPPDMSLATSFTLTMPDNDGDPSQFLQTDGSGILTWATPPSAGDVNGPASATDNALVRFDGTTGKLIQNSGVILDNSDNLTGINQLTTTGNVAFGGTVEIGTTNTITFTASPTSSYTMTLPPDGGTSGQLLQTSGAGTTDWVDNPASPAGSDGYIQYKTGTSFDADSGLTWLLQHLYVNGSMNLDTPDASGTASTTGCALNIAAHTFTENSGSPTVALNVFNSLGQPTVASTTLSTDVTQSATLYIAGEPLDGTNVTIGEPYAIYVASGASLFQTIDTQTISCAGTITGNSLTDGTLTVSSGNITGAIGINATTFTGTNFTDGTSTLSSGTLTGLVAPSVDSDAANKGYVDTIAQGVQWKDAVRLASVANHSLAAEQTVDGVAALSGDRVLLKNQNFPRQNGIWIVSVSAWTRASDLDEGDSAAGASMLVEQGNTNANAGYVCNTPSGSDTVGNNAGSTGDDLTFVQFTGAGSLIAGAGLDKSGNTLSVNVDDSTIEIITDTLQVKGLGIGSGQLANNSVITTKITDGNVTNAKLANDSVTVTAGDGLQNGGIVSLGNTITLNVDSTVIRTTGNQTKAGTLSFTDTTQSTSKTTGAITISGGLGVAKDVFVDKLVSSNAVQGTSVTDGIATLSSGNLSSVGSIGATSLTATGTVQGATVTDGTLSINSGAITSGVSATFSGTVTGGSITDGTATLSSGTLTGLVTPSASTDATNKAYVDGIAAGIQWKDPSRVATTANITLSGLQTIDGVTVIASDRVLVKNQTTQSENGIYDAASGSWTRSSDMSSGSAKNFATLVEEGTVNIGSSWVVTDFSPYTIGTSNLVWTQFASSGSVNAGAGLDKVGNTLSVSVDNSTIEILSNDVQVKDSGITASKLDTDSVTTNKIADGDVTNAKLANDSLTVTAGDGLQTGGSVALGSSVTLDVDTTVLRTTGNQSASGIQSFTNTTQSTTHTNGAVVISGGLGVAKDIYTNEDITLAGTLTGDTLTDGTLSINSGAISSAISIGTGSLTATGTVQGNSITDGTATLTGGDLSCVDVTASGTLTLSSIPTDQILFTTAGGAVTYASGLSWNGTSLSATQVNTQHITRPNDANQATLWNDGVGNIDIGLAATGTIQMGQGPMFKVTSTTSIMQSALTLQGGFSRTYSVSTIAAASNVTYSAGQVHGGILYRICNGADRTDTLPTAASLVAAVPEAVVGSSIEFFILNYSTNLELLRIVGNTGTSTFGSLTVAAGITNRFVALFTNISFGTEAVIVFASVPKDRVMLQCSIQNAAQGGNSTKYATWGVSASADVDATVLGYSGTITQLVACFSHDNPIGMNNPADQLAFSIGTANDTMDVFTPYTGGTDVIVWTNAVHGTYPSSSSGPLAIPVSATDRVAIRSQETNSATPAGMELRFTLTIQLD